MSPLPATQSQAHISAVQPWLSCARTDALWASSNRAMPACDLEAASMRHVRSCASVESTLAPRMSSISISSTSKASVSHAKQRVPEVSATSMLAFASSNVLMIRFLRLVNSVAPAGPSFCIVSDDCAMTQAHSSAVLPSAAQISK